MVSCPHYDMAASMSRAAGNSLLIVEELQYCGGNPRYYTQLCECVCVSACECVREM